MADPVSVAASPAIPSEAIRLIQEFEGCHRLDPADGLIHAYPDPLTHADPWTIGWGTTVYPDGRRVAAGTGARPMCGG